MPNELVPIGTYFGESLRDRLPQGEAKQAKRTITQIQNAWVKSMLLDEGFGGLYVSTEHLHTILRLSRKVDAHYLVQTMPDESKKIIGNQVYVATYEILKILDKRLQEVNLTTRSYVDYSQKLYGDIRDASEVRLKQEEIKVARKNIIKGLKAKRMKSLKIKKDELTGMPLQAKSAEFSHIRSQSMYPHLATDSRNGLIVNKETHELVTGGAIHNEDQLYELCMQNNWSITWYQTFIQAFR